jgi:hypothetical protein
MAENEKVPVVMTEMQWRALAALIWSAISITSSDVHRTLFKSLYDEIQAQVNVPINPTPGGTD